MYPSTFNQPYPTGLGFIWRLNGNVFTRKIMTGKKVSLGSIQWLDYIQNNFDELIDKDGKRVRIKHGWNGKEVKLGKYYVDGYAVVDGRQFIFEYDGCKFHDCKKCDREMLYKRDENERSNFLKNLPNTTIMRQEECEWIDKLKSLKYTPKISPILFKSKVYPEQMLKLLKEKKLFGFLIVDIVATQAADKFRKLNWPPILKKALVEFSDLPEWMREGLDEKQFPKEQIVQSMHAKDLLLHTCLLEFYLDHGFKVEKIHEFFEYEPSKCFEKVYSTVYEARVLATEMQTRTDATEEMKNAAELKATAVKLVSNSMYGQMLQVSHNFLNRNFKF